MKIADKTAVSIEFTLTDDKGEKIEESAKGRPQWYLHGQASLVPGLEICQVVETAPDFSWQRIRHVMNYSWYVPKVSYEIRASYDQPSRVSIERVSGDLRTLRGSWQLGQEGDYTIAHYTVDLVPGFWVPQWLVRSALRRDLPKMLRACGPPWKIGVAGWAPSGSRPFRLARNTKPSPASEHAPRHWR